MFQKEAYKNIGIDMNGIQVLKGMIKYFSSYDINTKKDILGYAIYELGGRKLG